MSRPLRQVIVCLDRRHHGTGRLAYSGLAPFQGPALLVYNNSIFTEEDFESISRVGGSKKRTQAGKTGRFGWVPTSYFLAFFLVSTLFVIFLVHLQDLFSGHSASLFFFGSRSICGLQIKTGA